MYKIIIKKNSLINYFIVTWAASLSFVTLSIGALEFNFSILLYPTVFFPLILLPFCVASLKNNLRKRISNFILFIILVAGLTSTAYHNDIAMMFGPFAFVLLLFAGLYVYPALFNRRHQYLFIKSTFIFSLIYFIFFSFKFGLSIGANLHYENTNTLGISAASVAILGLGLLFSLTEEDSILFNKIVVFLGVCFMLFLSLLSMSRTAVLSILLVFFLLMILHFFRAKTLSRFKFIFFIILICFSLFYTFGDLFIETIIEKFNRKENDIFDNRSILWQFIFYNTGFLGLGMDFFRYESFISAHSTYFSFLGRYGWVFFIPFILLLIFLFTDILYKLVFKHGDSFGFVLVSLFFGFLLMSITEIMIFKTIMIYTFIFIGDYSGKMDLNLNSNKDQFGTKSATYYTDITLGDRVRKLK